MYFRHLTNLPFNSLLYSTHYIAAQSYARTHLYIIYQLTV